MDCPFVIGQRVVCIAPGPWISYYNKAAGPSGIVLPAPKLNEICRVTFIEKADHLMCNNEKYIGIGLVGYPGNSFWHRHFRPLNERPKNTSIEVFKRMLNPAPKLLPAPKRQEIKIG